LRLPFRHIGATTNLTRRTAETKRFRFTTRREPVTPSAVEGSRCETLKVAPRDPSASLRSAQDDGLVVRQFSLNEIKLFARERLALLFPEVTTANKITVVRIFMIPVFVTLAIYYGESIQRGDPQEWQRFAAIIVFLLAAASDGLDGYVARRYNQRSRLGVILDPIADKGLLLSGIITLSITNWSQSDPNYGKFPVWFPVLVITRDAVILVGAAILHYFIGNKMKVKPSWTGKVATVCQMCAIAWVMLQLRFLPLWFVVSVAGIFTAVSGVIYVIEGIRQLQAEGHAHATR
jgi:cardiolipin synthase (CMP-forming)